MAVPDWTTIACNTAYAAALGAGLGGFLGTLGAEHDSLAPVRSAAVGAVALGLAMWLWIVWGALMAELLRLLPRCAAC